MTSISAYLTFSGNCREAMTFYQACLGGELTFQTVGESPISDQMPEPMKNSILHSTLTNGELVIMASDMVGEKGLIKGNAVSLMLHCNSEDETKTCYEKLSQGGEQTHPLEISFWGAWFGDLTDKYGNQWLMHCSTNNN
jgi:PhnB protein